MQHQTEEPVRAAVLGHALAEVGEHAVVEPRVVQLHPERVLHVDPDAAGGRTPYVVIIRGGLLGVVGGAARHNAAVTSDYPGGQVFELRKGWTLRTVCYCLFSAAMVAFGFTDPWSVLSILIWLLFGTGLVLGVIGAVRGGWYFRADADGPAIRATTINGEQLIRLPWNQVQAIVLWKAQHNTWVGVIPRPDVTVGTAPDWMRSAARLAVGSAAQMGMMLHGPRPDLPQLALLLDEIAPHVSLVDHSRRRPILYRRGTGFNPFG